MAHPDFDKLFQILLPFAQHMINKHGEFYPFGATMDMKGEVAVASSYTDSEKPEWQECSDLLIGGFRSQAKEGKIRACGICYNVRTIPPGHTEKLDAISRRL